MKAKREQPSSEEMERFRKNLDLKIMRLVAESIKGWRKCDQVPCRRAKRCASAGYECIARWRATLPPVSEEEAAPWKADFKRELEARIAGLPPDAFKKARRAQARSAAAPRTASSAPDGNDGKAPAPAADAPQLSPEKQARIDRAWNDYVASRAEDKERGPGPRITQL